MKFKIFILLLFVFFLPQAQLRENVFYPVTKISDGDTFYVMNEYREKVKIRLIGVDAPESRNVGLNIKKEYFGKESKIFLKQLLTGKKVKFSFDVQKIDKFGRVLAYVYLQNGIFLNQYLVEKGYAVMATYPPNVRYVEVFRQSERNARNNNRGLWK